MMPELGDTFQVERGRNASFLYKYYVTQFRVVMPNTGKIYCAHCIFTGKKYIGQTIKNHLQLRINEHYSDCTNYNHKFANALKKYGRGGFIWGVVEETDKLNEREVYWIEYYDSYGNGYNSTPGGQLSADYKCKEYLIENLNGDRELIFNLSNYCRDNDLNIGHLHETLYGKRLQHKGYKLIPRTEEEIKRYNDERLIRQDTSRKRLSGERNGRAKLDWNKVNQIRKLHSLKRHKNIQIAEMFDIKITTLEKIVANKLWTV